AAEMWIPYGSSTDVTEVGAVADICPHCGRLVPCNVKALCKGMHVYFITLFGSATEGECTCSNCGGQFRCELWRYKAFVPTTKAHTMTTETLLEQTNPSLRERLEWSEKQQRLGTNPQFLTALQSVEQLQQGPFRAKLMELLRQWDRLDKEQQGVL